MPSLYSSEYLSLDSRVTLGYSYWQGIVSVSNNAGLSQRDSIQLHSIPISAGPQVTLRHPRVQVISLLLGGAVGANWISQAGKLDGLANSQWFSFYSIEGGLLLFSNHESRVSGSWFQGVSLLYGIDSAISDAKYSTQKLSAGARIGI